jgi:hypothetical protein
MCLDFYSLKFPLVGSCIIPFPGRGSVYEIIQCAVEKITT